MHRGIGFTLAVGLVAACSGIGPDRPEIGPPDSPAAISPSPDVSGEVFVLAASSLTEAFTEIADRFEPTAPLVNVLPSFAASSTLRAQLDAGVPADVIATADEATMAGIVSAGQIGDLDLFASNRLAIAVETGNPLAITSLDDLARSGVAVGACVGEAPCGRLADAVLAEAGMRLDFVTREPNVKAAVSKVELGELDAALVYATDITSADVDGVDILTGLVNRYPIGISSTASNRAGAQAFVEFVISDEGRQILADFGFTDP